MEKTIFQKIIDREIPATIVYEDDVCVAFLDAHPINIGHTLVVPREPYKDIYELPEDVAGHLFIVAKKLAIALKQAVPTDGINITMNNEAPAGQVVFHAHIHVMPRVNGDGFLHWHGTATYQDGERELVAEKIRNAL